jgi:hypothetical protein
MGSLKHNRLGDLLHVDRVRRSLELEREPIEQGSVLYGKPLPTGASSNRVLPGVALGSTALPAYGGGGYGESRGHQAVTHVYDSMTRLICGL